MSRGHGYAPGKLIVLGEHAVVYGEPALGLPLSKGAKATLTPGTGQVSLRLAKGLQAPKAMNAASPTDLVARTLQDRHSQFDVQLELQFPPMSGMGSSAALVVAVLRALEDFDGRRPSSPRRLFDRTLDAERAAHAKPSGVDPAICLYNGLIRYVRSNDGAPKIRRLTVKSPVHLVVASAGAHGGTRTTVSRLAELRTSDKNLVETAMRTLGQASIAGQQALKTGDGSRLGRALDMAHGVLAGFGLVAASVHEGVHRLRDEGALGAKMSGAGGQGGAFFGAFDTPRAAGRATRALTRAGYVAWTESMVPG